MLRWRLCVPENDDAQGNENQQGDAGECERLTATDCANEGGYRWARDRASQTRVPSRRRAARFSTSG
jgi:hypothetical protein